MRQQTFVIRHQNKRNVFSFHSRALSPVRSQRCVFLSYHSTTIQGTSLVGWLAVGIAVLPRSHIALIQACSQLTIQLAAYSKNTQRAVQLLVQANAQVLLQSGYSLREVLQSFYQKEREKISFQSLKLSFSSRETKGKDGGSSSCTSPCYQSIILVLQSPECNKQDKKEILLITQKGR